jgi:hypothetical protein
MSWLFSRALVAEYSAGTCSGGEPSAPLSVMPTAHKFWRRGKTIDASDLSLFGLTCAVLTDDAGEAVLTSFLRDFPAKTFPPLARAQASTANGPASGRRSSALLATWSPDTSCWKTAQPSLLADSGACSVTWPASGSMRNGECFELPRWASLTNESGYGCSLPTPSGVNGGRNHTMGRVDEWGGSSNPLRGTVIGSMCSEEFEELVMGWPIGWTELTPFGMARFREWLREHGENLPHDINEQAA